MDKTHGHGDTGMLFIGDDLALDFINTLYGVGEARRECFNSDAQVQDWLRQAGLPCALPDGASHGDLLRAALELREAARGLVERRKAGAHGDPALVNRILELGGAYQELVWNKGQEAPVCVQHRRAAIPQALLVPVAEAIARLLAGADFALVRACESADCTLWFHDRTKSHHRRWCSMAACGNRNKVAEFRARRRKA